MDWLIKDGPSLTINWEIIYFLTLGLVPLFGNCLFQSQSHPVVKINFIGLPIPSHVRELNFFNPGLILLMGVKLKQSQSQSQMTKPEPAEACSVPVWNKLFIHVIIYF